ncbi:hypothetical protein KCU88_g73, partial [Aureobasidium melanogenum]
MYELLATIGAYPAAYQGRNCLPSQPVANVVSVSVDQGDPNARYQELHKILDHAIARIVSSSIERLEYRG